MYAMVGDCNKTGYLYPNVIYQCVNLPGAPPQGGTGGTRPPQF